MPELDDRGRGRCTCPALLADALRRLALAMRGGCWPRAACKLDGEPLPADQLDVEPDGLDGEVLQVGKRQFRRLRVRD